ncbi:MAG: Fur family transcriptional regulator [Ilumatobacter sp.]|jgi:Fur family transcriptional regulator, ferric uptake regulator|uniref:Fur family transcriptional regulator n=1 Tax=Ilumatobacter sp. TaxID=1967498 RepID=UPI00391C8AC3
MSEAPLDLVGLHDSVRSKLLAADQMYTTGRRELVELLVSVGRPATVAELLELRPKLTQSSLYRNMAALEAVNVVQKVVSTDDRVRFELSEELMGHHHHMICELCGKVEDFAVPARSEKSIEAMLERVVADSGFTASGHRLDVVGACADCS